MAEEFRVEQSEQYEGKDWWNWAVWVEASDEALQRIDYVGWTLHPTFTNPIRRTEDRASKFRLETGGWGVFPIVARVQLKDGKQMKLRHQLKLHYPDGKANTD